MPNSFANLCEPVPQRAYSIDQACATLAVGRTMLFDLIGRKEIVSITIGRRRLILATSLDAYLERLVAEQSNDPVPLR